jgi:lipid-A-disaccharide synthase-like uncharacterized protein
MVVNLGVVAFTVTLWTLVGFLGQAFFSMRFLVQWIVSERVRQSVIPVAFWYFSIFGGATLFVYALHIEDPVFIVGQGAGLLIYGRNLYFIQRDRKKKNALAAAGGGNTEETGTQ